MISIDPSVTTAIATAVRNVFGAGDGSVPPSAAAAALSQLLWNMHNAQALAWGQNAYNFGGSEGDIEASFRHGFAESLGWSQAEFDAFWNDPNYDFTPEDAAKYDQAYDDFFKLTEHLKSR
jgi:hypothetical protein